MDNPFVMSVLNVFWKQCVSCDILVFCIAIWFMYESHRLCDLSQAYALLGIVASLAPVIFGYYSKSKAENTEGGIVYETAMKEQEITSNSESGKG